jgi:hypothetical protein
LRDLSDLQFTVVSGVARIEAQLVDGQLLNS